MGFSVVGFRGFRGVVRFSAIAISTRKTLVTMFITMMIC